MNNNQNNQNNQNGHNNSQNNNSNQPKKPVIASNVPSSINGKIVSTKKDDKKNMIIGIVLALALIFAFIYATKNKKVEAPINTNDNGSNSVVSTPSSNALSNPNDINYSNAYNGNNTYSSNSGVAIPTEMPDSGQLALTNTTYTYTQAFMKYVGKNILQFSNNCQARPFDMVIPNGSTLLLDNRADNAETIKIGDNKYDLAPYGFRVITINEPKVPVTYTIDCKVAQNVSTLTVE